MATKTGVKKVKGDPKWLVNPKAVESIFHAGKIIPANDPIPATMPDSEVEQLKSEGVIYLEGTKPQRPPRRKPVIKMRDKRDDLVVDHDEWRESARVPNEFDDEDDDEDVDFYPDEKDDDEEEDSEAGEITIQAEKLVLVDETEPPVKRKRGRPRKNPEAANA